MPELEKVIAGLESCRPGRNCGTCPYHEFFDKGICNRRLEDDALALLEAQMPRVMTLDEAKAHLGNPVWVEEKVVVNGYWKILFDVDGEAFHMTTGQIEFGGMLTGHSMFAVNCYGTDFRLWTSRPTPEQMASTPWEGEKDA